MILQSIEELEAALNRGEFHPGYVVMGPEEYLCRQAIALIKRRVLTSDALAFNYAEFSARNSRARDALEAAHTCPMMAPRRLILLTNLEDAETVDQELLLAYFDRPSGHSILVMTAADLDKRTSFYRQLKDKACVLSFQKLKGPELEKWAQNFIRNRGFTISHQSLAKAVDLAGEDLQSVLNELEKLMIYAGQQKTIPDAAVNDLIRSSRHHTVFELINALGARDCPNALRQLGTLIDSGEEPLAILSMMARHFRQVLIATDLLEAEKNARAAAAAAQVPSFVADAFMRQARVIGRDRALAMYLRLAETDYRFKSSPADKRMVLEDLIYSL